MPSRHQKGTANVCCDHNSDVMRSSGVKMARVGGPRARHNGWGSERVTIGDDDLCPVTDRCERTYMYRQKYIYGYATYHISSIFGRTSKLCETANGIACEHHRERVSLYMVHAELFLTIFCN